MSAAKEKFQKKTKSFSSAQTPSGTYRCTTRFRFAVAVSPLVLAPFGSAGFLSEHDA